MLCSNRPSTVMMIKPSVVTMTANGKLLIPAAIPIDPASQIEAPW